MAAVKMETGVQLLARLGTRPDLSGLDHDLFGKEGPGKSSIIEFFGETGTGKTQMILHLTANALLPYEWVDIKIGGSSCGVVVLDTDYNFCILRLTSILENKINSAIKNHTDSKHSVENKEKDTPTTLEERVEELIRECIHRLHVVRCNSTTQLVLSLYSLENLLSSKPDIGLLVIDSVSAFYWLDRSVFSESTSAKDSPQNKVLTALKHIVDMFKICTVVARVALFTQKTKQDSEQSSFAPHTKTEKWNYLGRQWSQAISSSFHFGSQFKDSGKVDNFFVDINWLDNKGCHRRKFSIQNTGIVFIS